MFIIPPFKKAIIQTQMVKMMLLFEFLFDCEAKFSGKTAAMSIITIAKSRLNVSFSPKYKTPKTDDTIIFPDELIITEVEM